MEALLNVGGNVSGQTSIISEVLRVNSRGDVHFGQAVQFGGVVELQAGSLKCGSNALFKDTLRLVGTSAQSFTQTELSVPNDPGLAIVEKDLEIDGATGTAQMRGHLTVRRNALWKDATVSMFGILRLESLSPATPAVFQAESTAGLLSWSGDIQFGPGASLRLASPRRMDGNLLFEQGSSGIPAGHAQLVIRGSITAEGPDEGTAFLPLAGPLRFEQQSSLNLERGLIELSGKTNESARVEFVEQSRLISKVDLVASGLVIDDQASVIFEPATAQDDLVLAIRSVETLAELDFRNGSIRAARGRLEIANAGLIVVGPEARRFRRPAVNFAWKQMLQTLAL